MLLWQTDYIDYDGALWKIDGRAVQMDTARRPPYRAEYASGGGLSHGGQPKQTRREPFRIEPTFDYNLLHWKGSLKWCGAIVFGLIADQYRSQGSNSGTQRKLSSTRLA